MTDTMTRPPHPYFCDECGGRAPFKIAGCPVEHALSCPRHGEDPMAVFERAKAYCRETGKAIP
jgi:hypothetical protein